jgi:CHAT domain-containing protein
MAALLLILALSLDSIPGVAHQIPGDRATPTRVSASLAAPDLVQQGKTAYQQGQLNQAMTLWQQAAAAFAAQGDRLHQAMTLSYLAQAHQQAGAWDKARTAIAQSLELLQQPNPGTGGDRLRILAEAQTIQGSLQLDQGQAAAAFTSWQQAAETFRQVGDRAGVIRSQINQSQALVILGLYKRANQLLEPLYAKLPPEDPLQLAILLNYGETLRLVGHLQPDDLQPSPNSEAVLQQGLALAQALHSPADITRSQISLGNTYRAIYYQQKRLQPHPCQDPQVLAYQHKALQAYQTAAAMAIVPTSKIQALLNQQSLLLGSPADRETIGSQPAQTVATIASQIQANLDRLPLNRTSLYARIQLAYNLLQIDNRQPAVPLLQTAINQAAQLGDRAAQSYALGYLAQSYAQPQQTGTEPDALDQALTLTTQALQLARELNIPEITYRWLWQLGWLERNTHPERALQSYRAAYRTLQSFRTNLAPDNPDLQFSFRENTADRIYREFVDLLLKTDPAKPKALSSDSGGAYLQEARQVIQDLQSAELSNFLQEPCALSNIEAIDKRVDEPGSFTATLYPILLPDRIEVIAKFPNKPLFHYTYPISETEARQKLAKFQFDLQLPYTFDQIKQEGQEIYRWLINPAVQAELESAKINTIVFSPDGPLRNIPMAALHDGSGYLIEKYAVAVTLDLVVTDPKSLPSTRLNVLVASLAEPPKQKTGFRFARLPYVDAEVKAIQKMPGIAVTPIQGQQFTRDGFNQKFNGSPFQIVHIATHGQFSSNPAETFILTAASSAKGQLSDGKVRLKDFDAMFRTRVLNRPDAIDLLILSACETASGDDRATLGIAGTAVRAGARSAIASLWSLDDASSQTLVTTFYKAITHPQTSRAEALRQAQLALLQAEEGAYTHPRYWAPFLLVGNWL